MPSAGQDVGLQDGFPRPDKHMPALDSLRGIAITANLCYHGLGNTSSCCWSVLTPLELKFFSAFKFGYLGVHLFFTLSGFLITGILLDTRHKADYFKQFYIRRALRILPVFLLMIVLLKCLHQISWAYLGLTLIFLSNLALHMDGGSNYQAFWTLSVEEQFYILWPVLIRWLRPRTSFILAITLVVVSSPLRYAVAHLPPHYNDMFYKTWDVLDFFGGGAAMAMVIRSPRLRPHLQRIFLATLGVGAFLLLLHHWIFPGGASVLSDATLLTPIALLFSAAILGGFLYPGLGSTWLGRRFAFMGFISYSLYLYHPVIENVIESHWELVPSIGFQFVALVLARFLVFAAVAILVAWISRTTFEAYFLKMKPRSAGPKLPAAGGHVAQPVNLVN